MAGLSLSLREQIKTTITDYLTIISQESNPKKMSTAADLYKFLSTQDLIEFYIQYPTFKNTVSAKSVELLNQIDEYSYDTIYPLESSKLRTYITATSNLIGEIDSTSNIPDDN